MVRMSRILSRSTSPSTGLDWNMYFTFVGQGLMSQIDAMLMRYRTEGKKILD